MARTILLTALLMLAACGSQPRREEVMLAELASVLPGSYDNIAQSRQQAGRQALRLVIAPVQAPLVGRHVFYVQEMAADDPRRVFSQRLFVLNPIEGQERVLLGQADLNENARWRDGHLNRDLFKSLLPQDVRPRAGCELLIVREGGRFTGTGGTACRMAAPGSGETLRVEQKLELDTDGLALFEEQRDAAGVTVGPADPWNRFARRADAPW